MLNATSRRWLSILLGLTTLALVSAGCFTGDAQYHLSEAADPSDGDGPRAPGSAGDDYQLEPLADLNHVIDAESQADVSVQLTDDQAQPVADEMVDFQIYDADDADDATIGAGTSFTDDDGVAANELRAGEITGTVTVRASHPRAPEPVDFTVDITTIPPGDLLIGVDYDDTDRLALSGADIQVWNARDVECIHVTATNDPGEPTIAEPELDTVQDQALVDQLNATDDYTVVATGLGPEGQPSAHGCIDGVDIEGDATTEVSVPLDLTELIPVGDYDVESIWDFTEALSVAGPVGQTIDDVLGWISDPAQMAADYLAGMGVDWVCDEYGDSSNECLAAMGAESTIADEAADFLDSALQSIPGVSDLLDLGDQLVDTVENALVKSELIIEGKAVGENELSGLDIWNSITFEWGENCDFTPATDCEQFEVGLDGDDDFGVVQAEWDGRLYDYNQLEIDPHDMSVPYGTIILHVLEEHLIPAITGGEASTISGAFDELLCSNLGSFSFSFAGFGFDVDASTVQGWCTTVFSTAGIIGESYLNGLEYDVDFSISGEGRMIDMTGDASVDRIDDGMFYGELEGEDGEVADLDAEFTADRVQ